jgi:hypothetical protein
MTSPGRVPLWFKLSYTGFCAVLIPFYLYEYGWTTFLYFCDVALLATLAATWLEKPLLASAPAVGILIPQVLWVIDLSLSAAGLPASGTTSYMFSETIPLFTRLLSFYHAWLPLAISFLVWKLGYDKRALPVWTATAWSLLLFCYYFMPAPPAPPHNPNLPVNINFVNGLGDKVSQNWLPPLAWLSLLILVLPLTIFIPTHLLLRKFAPQVSQSEIST